MPALSHVYVGGGTVTVYVLSVTVLHVCLGACLEVASASLPCPPVLAPWQAGCLLPSSWERSPGLTLRCLLRSRSLCLCPPHPAASVESAQSSQPCPPLSSLGLCGFPTHGVAFGASGLGLPEGAPIGQLTSHRPSSLPGHTVNSAAATSKANLGPDSYVFAFKNTRF